MRRERPEYAVFTLVSATVLLVQLMMVMATIWNRLCKLFLMNCGGYASYPNKDRFLEASLAKEIEHNFDVYFMIHSMMNIPSAYELIDSTFVLFCSILWPWFYFCDGSHYALHHRNSQ